jgi:hypothetical protein
MSSLINCRSFFLPSYFKLLGPSSQLALFSASVQSRYCQQSSYVKSVKQVSSGKISFCGIMIFIYYIFYLKLSFGVEKISSKIFAKIFAKLSKC